MLDYNIKINEIRKQSVNELRKNINSKQVSVKIKTYCEKWDDDFDNVKNKIKTDTMIARIFVKDPKKQNVYENEALIYLQTEKEMNIKKLPAGGKNSLCLKNGNIVNKVSTKTSKSIDFIENTPEKTIYYLHKYINDEGGAQDNQYRDCVDFIEKTTKYIEKHEDNVSFVAILDGKFFQRKNRLETLKKQYKNNRLEIKTINDF